MKIFFACLCTFFSIGNPANAQIKLSFESSGKMTKVEYHESSDNNICFEIDVKDDFFKDQLSFPILNIYKTYERLSDTSNDDYFKYMDRVFHINKDELEEVRKELEIWLSNLPKEYLLFYDLPFQNENKSPSYTFNYVLDLSSIKNNLFTLTIKGKEDSPFELSYNGKGKYSYNYENTNKDEIEYEIRFNKPFYYNLVDWTKEKIKTDYVKYCNSFEKAVKDFNKTLPISKELTTEQINSLSLELKNIDSVLLVLKDYLRQNKKTILSWLWYTGGDPRINPYPKLLEKPNSNSLKYFKSQLETLKKATDNNTLGYTDFTELSRTIASLESKIDKINKDSRKYDEALAQQNELTFEDIFLYKGWLTTVKKSKAIEVHHDATNNYKLISDNYPASFPEYKKLYAIVENSTKNSKLSVTTKPIESHTTVDDLILLIQNRFQNGIPLLQEPTDKGKKTKNDSIICTLIIFSNKIRKDLESLNIYFNPWVLNKNLVQKDMTPKYYSQVLQPADTVEAPKYVTYRLSIDSITDSNDPKFSFKLNKLYFLWPALGLAYTKNPAREYSFENGTVTSSDYPQVRMTAGLKFYPFKTDISDKYFLVSSKRYPRIDHRKTNIYLGVIPKDPTRNILAGIGIDPVSGISFSIGCHWMQYRIPVLQNNTVISNENHWSRSVYFSLTIDPSAFTSLASFLGF